VVPAVEWMFADNADKTVNALRRSRALRKAAFAYAKATNNVPFFCRQPSPVPIVPKLNFFGRRVLQEDTGAQQEAGAQDDVVPAPAPAPAEAAQGEAGGRAPPPAGGRSGRVRGRGCGRRGRGRRALLDPDTEEEAEQEAQAGQLEALDRASSVCDRLRNLTARCVLIAHTLLGDPQVVGTEATLQARELYFAELDSQCIE
jgi:hypothetical protein